MFKIVFRYALVTPQKVMQETFVLWYFPFNCILFV